MKKKALLLILIIISISAIIFHTNKPKQIYGNDNTSILQWIKDYDMRIKDSDSNITIAGIEDTGDIRIVGYLKSNSVGMVAYHRNSKNNYEMYDNIRIGTTETSSFIAHYPAKGIDKIKYVVVSTGKDDIAMAELTVNEKYKQAKKIPLNKPSVIVFDLDLPQEEYKSMSFDCQFFDSDVNEIE
ncbi:hypothetical protein SH2C18_50420 [Clostridium sediminicola]|uniref:hypothetical protein n=1 Tax=Clostridium sediminicola TaxID=3114879 RepID=UPI0031F20E06